MIAIQILEDIGFRRLNHRAVLEADSALSIMGSYADPNSFSQALSRDKPDVVIISFIKDWVHKGLSTKGIVQRVKEHPDILCILLADPTDGLEQFCQLYDLGIDAFGLMFDHTHQQPPLNEIVHIVCQEGYYFHPITTDYLMKNYYHNPQTRRKEKLPRLSKIDQKILVYTLYSYKQSDIAIELGYSEANIKARASQIRNRLDAKSISEAVFKAMLYELIEQDIMDEIEPLDDLSE